MYKYRVEYNGTGKFRIISEDGHISEWQHPEETHSPAFHNRVKNTRRHLKHEYEMSLLNTVDGNGRVLYLEQIGYRP